MAVQSVTTPYDKGQRLTTLEKRRFRRIGQAGHLVGIGTNRHTVYKQFITVINRR